METVILTEKKNKFKIPYKETYLNFSGDFDSGNLNWAGLDIQKQQIQVSFGKDKEIKPSSRCWFYFTISGDYKYLPLNLNLIKVNSLTSAAKIYDLYRPVVKYQGADWQRHQTPVQFQISPENDISFRMTIDLVQSKKVSIALCYPWSVSDNDNYLTSLQKQASLRKDIYFNMETLIMSPEKRPVHLIAISNAEVASYPADDYIQHLFPNRQTEKHFKMIKKPMILITSRVHPGEIGSSYSLNGVIEFLMGGSDLATQILNEFYFLIVPILNPDGVFLGNNRMDSLGQNLNRFYHLPDIEKQPSCYALKALVQNTRKQLFAFFDFHGHSNKKSCFLFGNSINMNRLQTESVLFAKYLSQICDFVEFKSCNFSKKQMSSKDKNEDFSKEGCARVVVHRWTNSPYCYTLETGLYKNVKVDEKGIERYGQKFYSPEIYKEIGAKMVISLFQIMKKTKEIEDMRKSLSSYVIKLEKLNNKKDKIVKTVKRQTTKLIKKEEDDDETSEFRKVVSQKENQQKQEKSQSIEQILHSNKAYILSIDEDYDD